mmetsp:Transcript_44950/g.72190  ORF Transcript_44950/g.72190 Transcript_44950/m.72190 type:complete len:349 (+) Transcript_44950:79-1125(+)
MPKEGANEASAKDSVEVKKIAGIGGKDGPLSGRKGGPGSGRKKASRGRRSEDKSGKHRNRSRSRSKSAGPHSHRKHKQRSRREKAADAEELVGKTMMDTDPLIKAAKGSDPSVLKNLLLEMDPHKRTLKVNQFDKAGSTLLFHAAWVGNRDIVQCLVDYRADPNIQNNRQNSPLHLAFERMNRGAMLVLVENGADIDLKNSWGQKPYEVKLKDNVNPGILELNKLEELLKDARRKYLDSHSHEVEDTITDEERSKYKTMYDMLDEDKNGALTYHEMYRLFHQVPVPESYNELGIPRVDLASMKAFNEEFNISHNVDGVVWMDFLSYVHKFKKDELAASSKKKKKGKKK